MVVIDQFEELFTVCSDEEERAAFVDRLTGLADDPDRTAVVIGLRGDFYGHCAAYPELARRVAANQVLVGPMTADEVQRAVELPARRAGVRVDAHLVDTLVAEVGEEPGALPLLSTSLVELWFDQVERPSSPRVPSAARRHPRRGRALAESSYENLDPAQRMPPSGCSSASSRSETKGWPRGVAFRAPSSISRRTPCSLLSLSA